MRLIAFGDSMVAGAGDPEHLGWVGRAVSRRRDITLYNLGVRRETSANIALRWESETRPRLTPDEPMRIVVSFGINDAHLVNDTLRVTHADSLKNAHAILTGAGKLCPVLMVGPPPVVDPGVCARLEGLNESFNGLATRLGVPFIDVLRPLMADGIWQAEAAAWDGAHPGAGGYQQMADLVSAHPAWRSFTQVEE